ncbi:MAG: hypothetical protein E2598_01520 [Sphingobium sp.]|nr:hypothetical protein [Sphingobium sp.]
MNRILDDDSVIGAVNYEHAATALHAKGRMRADVFHHKIMVDSAMDVMLSALITHEQGIVLKKQAVAMANRLNSDEAAVIIGQLSVAGLLRVDTQSDQVMLTDQGVARMRRYVEMVMADR